MTTESTWQTNATRKHLQLIIEADSKRGHLLELQNRLREISVNEREANHQVDQANSFFEFVERSEARKKLLDAAKSDLDLIIEMKKSLNDQVAQISPSVQSAVKLANAAERVLINLNIQRA